MPPLPAPDVAAAADPDTAIASAVDSLRAAIAAGVAPPPQARDVFLQGLARAIGAAMAPATGDPAFQALLLRSAQPQVEAYAQLVRGAVADRRAVRAAVDAHAHPGKWRDRTEAEDATTMSQLHALATQERWWQLRELLEQSQAAPVRSAVPGDALQRLVRRDELQGTPAVQAWLALCRQQGPARGSAAASASGRDAARTGKRAEQHALAVLAQVAAMLDAVSSVGCWRAVGGLRTPGGFPGATAKAKDEWDAALLRRASDAPANTWDIALLAEVKAAPAAAASDYPRLLRGLERLGTADAGRTYEFPSGAGAIRVRGTSLRELAPIGRVLPTQVVYACSADAESRPLLLAAAAKAVLLAEPAALAYARHLQGGGPAEALRLEPVWQALQHEPRLRGALHQWDTARSAREAMVHPDDLLEAVRAAMA